jgi:AraC-like DNA-binding protein
MFVKTTKLDIYDGLEIKDCLFKNQSFPKHFHDTFSIGIIKKGFERISIIEKEFLTPSNTVVIVNPFETHDNSFFDNFEWAYQCLYLNQEIFVFIAQKLQISISSPLFLQNIIENDTYLFNLIEMFNHDLVTTNEQVESLIKHLIVNYQCGSTVHLVAKNDLIEDCSAYLLDNLFEKINIDSVAQKFSLSPFQLIRHFKKEKGITPISYLLMHRIIKAKNLLSQTNSLVEVALETGFFDQAHFAKYFKKYVGVTPLQYKQGII